MYFRLEFGKPKTEKRSDYDLVEPSSNPENPTSNPARWFDYIFGTQPTSSGVKVDPGSAPSFSAVYRSVQIISSTLASLPLLVIKKTGKGREIATNHPAYQILRNPSDIYTTYLWRENMMQFCLLWGNGYSEIIRDQYFQPDFLDIHEPRNVRPFIAIRQDQTKGIFYEVTEIDPKTGRQRKRVIESFNMIHIPCLSFDGVSGKSIVEVARENIGLGLAAEKFGGNFYKNNAAYSGIYTHPGELNEEAYQRLKKSLEQKAEYGEKAKPLLLEAGTEFKQLTMPLQDAQFLDSRKFQVNEIARMFGVPPHKIGDLSASTNNNIEQQALEFITDTMWSWCEKWEAELDRKLFTEKEKAKETYCTHFDFDRLMRGDSQQRSNYFRTMFAIGAMNQDEIREVEGRNPLPDDAGQKYYVPLNMVDSSKIDENEPNETNEPKPGGPGLNGNDPLQLSNINKNGN